MKKPAEKGRHSSKRATKPPAEAQPTVRRPLETGEAFTKKHQAVLSRLIEKRWRAQAKTNAGITQAEQRANEPLLRLVEGSPDAKVASRELGRLRVKAWAERAALRQRGELQFRDGPSPFSFRPIGAGVNVFGPPYDWEVRDPTSGASVGVTPNRFDGTFSVGLGPGQGGARWATAGVGMVLQASIPGVAHVSPYWPFDFDWWIEGHWLSGHTTGACKIVVQDAFTGAVLGPLGERNVQFWDHTSQTSASGENGDTLWPPDVEATVALAAGQVFKVTFLATALVDDSEGSIFGWSLAGAGLRMRVPFFTVRMNIP